MAGPSTRGRMGQLGMKGYGASAGFQQGQGGGGQDFGLSLSPSIGQDPDVSPDKSNGGLPSLGQIDQFGADVSKFAFNPTLGAVSLATGFPIGAVLGIAHALGLEIDTTPQTEDRAQTRGRDTPIVSLTDQEYLDSVTDTVLVNFIEQLENEGFTAAEIRQELEMMNENEGLV